MNYDYPILKKVSDFYSKKKDKDLSRYKLYSCQHILEPQLEMYKNFITFGFLPENIFVLGKIYSSNFEIIDEMKGLGMYVEQPELEGSSFHVQHIQNCKKLADKISDDEINIILDDGAYLIEVSKDKNIFFAVEQTSSGFRKLENQELNFPVLNVARSKIKLTQESPLIARLIVDRVEDYLGKLKITDPTFLIVGLGPIGNSVHQVLSQDFSVLGIDKDDTGNLVGFIKDNNIDIVIGATGSQIISRDNIDELLNFKQIHFISVSSSDIEFPVEYFRENGGSPHDDVIYKNVTFVNNGFPITFKGNRYESTPIEIEKTIALLMGSVMLGVVENLDKKGLVDLPEALEDLIN